MKSESITWKITIYSSMIVLVILLVFIAPNIIFGSDVPREYIIIALYPSVGIILWLLGVGWFLAKKEYKIIGLMIWILVVIGTSFYWYWESNAFDRAIINLVDAEYSVKNPPSENKLYKEKLRNDYILAEAKIDRIIINKKYDEFNKSLPKYLIYSPIILIGIIMSALMLREILIRPD